MRLVYQIEGCTVRFSHGTTWFVLGLGIMGYSDGPASIGSGHEVALWTHSAGKASELASKGKGTACTTPKESGGTRGLHFLLRGTTAMARESVPATMDCSKASVAPTA